MRILLGWIVVAALFLACASCEAWPEQRRESAMQVIAEMETNGTITPEQAVGLRQAIDELAGGTTLEDVLRTVAEIGGSVVAALFGVRIVRGPPKPVPRGDVPLLAAVLERERRWGDRGPMGPPERDV